MDAEDFVKRNLTMELEVKKEPEKDHAERAKTALLSAPLFFKVQQAMCVNRPRPLGTHRTKTLFTPGVTVRGVG